MNEPRTSKERCKESVRQPGSWPRYENCTRAAVKDGYCKQHHPDSKQARREVSNKVHRERFEAMPAAQLARAREALAKAGYTGTDVAAGITQLRALFDAARAPDEPVATSSNELAHVGFNGDPHGGDITDCTACRSDDHLTRFSAWLVQQMPAGTVIGNPHWWAPKILAAACVTAPEAPTEEVPVGTLEYRWEQLTKALQSRLGIDREDWKAEPVEIRILAALDRVRHAVPPPALQRLIDEGWTLTVSRRDGALANGPYVAQIDNPQPVIDETCGHCHSGRTLADALRALDEYVTAVTKSAACTCPGTFPPDPGCHYSNCPAGETGESR